MAAPIGKNLKDTPTRVAPDAGAAKLARETPRDQAGEEAPVAPASPAKSIDAFDAVAVPTGVKAASGAVTEAGTERAAREADDGASALRDRLQSSESGGKGATTSGDIAGPARTEAAAAAEAAKGAVASRQEPALSRDLTEENGGTVEAPASLEERIGITNDDLWKDRGPTDFSGLRDEEHGEVPASFRDSARAALEGLVAAAFDADDSANSGASSGSGPAAGLIGIPGTRSGGVTGTGGAGNTAGNHRPAEGAGEALGVGNFGTTAGLDDSDDVGMGAFDVSVPTAGVSGAADDLAILQGLVPDGGADPNATPSVAYDLTNSDLGGAVVGADLAMIGGMLVATSAASAAAIGAAGGLALIAPVAEKPGFNDAAATWAAENLTENGKYAKEMEAAAAKAQAAAQEREAQKNAGGGTSQPGSSQPVDPDSAGHPELTPGYLAFRAAARERLGLGTPGSGDIDPGREGNEGAPDGPPVSVTEFGMAQKAAREVLVGQPGEGIVRGGGSIDLGRLPGDMGDIDFGPDSTGQWSGNTVTEDEGDALASLGGSGLGIADARRDDEEEEDEEEDSES